MKYLFRPLHSRAWLPPRLSDIITSNYIYARAIRRDIITLVFIAVRENTRVAANGRVFIARVS